MSLEPAVVFLDVGDTILRAHPSWAGVYSLGLREWGIELPQDQLERALFEATQSGSWAFEGPFEATEEASFERVKEFDQRVLTTLGVGPLGDDAFRSIERVFAQVSSWHVFPDVVPAIEALRAAGLRVAIISNWLWAAPELLHALELARHFEALVISARVGYQKPHPQIFRRALELLEVRPDTALHVGDNYQADVSGARRVGITPVLIDRRAEDVAGLRERHADPDLLAIRDLYELLDLLGIARPSLAGPRSGARGS